MNSKVILHKTKCDYVCELVINETCSQNTSSFETIIILDRSGSMDDNTDKLINRVFPIVFRKLNYKDSDTINLITFDSRIEYTKLQVRNFPSHPIHSRGGTSMSGVIPELEKVFRSGKKKFRMITISDGDVWDQEETVNSATQLAKRIQGLYSINSPAIRLYTSSSAPDTRAISSLLQLHTLKKVFLENVDANLSDNEIADIIIRLFSADSFEYDFVLHSNSNSIREELWSQKKNQLILNQGKNIFWIDNPEQFKLSINGSVNNISNVNGAPVNNETYQKILQDKINKYVQKIKVLKVVGTPESQKEITQMITDVQNYEKKILNYVPQSSITSKLKHFADGQDMKGLSNDEQAKLIQSDEGLDEDTYLDPKFTKVDPTDYYDLIINTKMFEDLSDPSVGWEIFKSEEAKQNYKALTSDKQPVIGVVGIGNKGKSYTLSKISGYTLPEGYSVETKGLSLKYYKESENKKFVLLDSAGSSTPLIETNNFSLNDIEDENKAREQIQAIQRDKNIMEEFLQRFIINYSNVILAVVGQMTYHEQKLLKRLKKIAQIQKKRLIIVHNLMNFTTKEQVQSYITHILKKIITFNLVEQTYISFGESSSEPQNKIYYAEKSMENGQCVHIILGSDLKTSETKSYYNEPGFAYIKHLLMADTTYKKFDPVANLQKHLEKCSFEYMDTVIPKENITCKNDKIYVEGVEIKLKKIMYSELGDSNFFGYVFEPKYSVWLQDPENEKVKKYIDYKNRRDIVDEWKKSNKKMEILTKELDKLENEQKKLSMEQLTKLINKIDGFLDFKMAGDMKKELEKKAENKNYQELVVELEVAGEKPNDLKISFKNVDSDILFHARGTKEIGAIKGECLAENKLKREKFESKIKIRCTGELCKGQEDIVYLTKNNIYNGVIRVSIPYSTQESVEETYDDL